MASILDKYGIKEVADITFYKADKNGKPAYPVLYIDTAKTSTIEQTADETTANGGKGNPALISWDYNKDINVTLEDALFSAKSLAIMFGNGTTYKYGDSTTPALLMKTEVFTATTSGTVSAVAGGDYGWNMYFEGPDGKKYNKLNPKFFDADGKAVATVVANEKYFCSFDLEVAGSVIRISPSTFPGTYYVTGDTWARSQANGDDEFFQFIIPKAKVKSENTITMEADGDPSVFNLDLHVLRPESGDMMMLVKYDLVDGTDPDEDDASIYHNHVLNRPMDDDNVKIALDADAKADAARVMGMDSTKTAYIENAPSAEDPGN